MIIVAGGLPPPRTPPVYLAFGLVVGDREVGCIRKARPKGGFIIPPKGGIINPPKRPTQKRDYINNPPTKE